MPEAKQIEQKMQSFEDVLFTVTSFPAEKLKKNNITGWGKKSKSL